MEPLNNQSKAIFSAHRTPCVVFGSLICGNSVETENILLFFVDSDMHILLAQNNYSSIMHV